MWGEQIQRLGSRDAKSKISRDTRTSQGLLAVLSALASNPASTPTSVESQHRGSCLTSECSLPEGALKPSNYPESCPFVSHPPCFLLPPDLFSKALFGLAVMWKPDFKDKAVAQDIYPSAGSKDTAAPTNLQGKRGQSQQHGPRGRGKLLCMPQQFLTRVAEASRG